jgi:hypothetical protein
VDTDEPFPGDKAAIQLCLVPKLSVHKHMFSRQSCTVYFQYWCFMFWICSFQCVICEAILFLQCHWCKNNRIPYVGLYAQRKIMLQIVYYLPGAFAELRKATVRFLVSVRPHGTAPTERIFVKFDIWKYFENLSRKFKVGYSLTKITGTLHEDLCTFMIICCWILLRLRNVAGKS